MKTIERRIIEQQDAYIDWLEREIKYIPTKVRMDYIPEKIMEAIVECEKELATLKSELSEPEKFQEQPTTVQPVCLSNGSCIHNDDGITCKDCHLWEGNQKAQKPSDEDIDKYFKQWQNPRIKTANEQYEKWLNNYLVELIDSAIEGAKALRDGQIPKASDYVTMHDLKVADKENDDK